MDSTAIIFMPLLNEGTDVWRPVRAHSIGNGVFRILEQPGDDEEWPFPTGSIVVTEVRVSHDGNERLVVVAKV